MKCKFNDTKCNFRNGHLTIWQCSLRLDQLTSVKPTSKKRSKHNDDMEDDIDLSKGEDRERYVTNKEGKIINNIINQLQN